MNSTEEVKEEKGSGRLESKSRKTEEKCQEESSRSLEVK